MENTAAQPLETLTTIDQNTRRPITWNIDYVGECGPNVGRYGWTHCYGVSRPRGRRSYMIHVELVGDVVVRHSQPVKVF